ncbi:hypothetical protein GA0116948_11216 [Chitinophaga costaii]|uniref:DUF6089 domain-containing protein n=1 Tax=Chitinophaga costaii TaxID=1335309 RepID=A0A1C4F6V0_9BACT|nr:DUF6089 family protein [Chitinophaga costaii]PUZ21269.1 hypothetical protein DCM91_17165 [Chitinophaga costaii]SCC51221.1 hypothetical protein GA0116948_11216 [Chitinophaga costaii]
MRRSNNTPRRFLISVLLSATVLWGRPVHAQQELSYTGELGFSIGAAHYFGDLNPDFHLNAPKPSVGIYYRRYMNDYIGVRAQLRFMQLGYSDVNNKQNEYDYRRNLSFNTNIEEFSLQGDFNFFRFEPGSLAYRFSPYLTGGLALFHFDPYAYLDGRKYYLQPLHTEGQGSALYPDRKPYGLISAAFLIGGGFKYNVSKKVNVGMECLYRFAQTDYLDDVSTTYAATSVFPPNKDGSPSVAYRLQDRSSALGNAISYPGRQRGNSRDKDQYLTLEFTISILFTSYHCRF